MDIPKSYDHEEVEAKWQEYWRKLGIHEFDRKDYDSPTYVIDTPPPYPSGEFHIGNALNWIYFDFVARYRRMCGYNTLFPQGWDCHGLPTEVQAEQEYGIKKGDMDSEEFRNLCVDLTEKNIEVMREEMNSLGLSIDWTTEYRTMDPEYYSKTQLSFLKLFDEGLIYQGKHPVNWCPRCETAIADAEVEYEKREGTLHYIRFEVVEEDDYLTIATTRPELLPACVLAAVHPSDDRYGEYVGRELKVPLFGQIVEVVGDREVDPDFGTGVVMVCTFGDKTDVEWTQRYELPVIESVDEKGNLTESAGDYAGMTLEEGKSSMVEDLDEEDQLVKTESLEQNVGVCWRCKTPVEILNKDQWFMRVLDLNDQVVDKAEEVRWVPDHMKLRLIDWASSMDWDWVISRQRIFATPIPIWYCGECDEPIIAEEDQLPVNPISDDPPVEKCPSCGHDEFEPEEDVLDTWMDSSVTIAVHAGWPGMDSRLFPADLQPNGTDIIRTWDYYLLVRHLALFGEIPYRTVLINGMVFGSDGRKMSKSLGNYVETTTARDRHGADALRQWAAVGASPGSDVPFSWKEIDHGHRFQRKLWNAARFASPHISDVSPEADIQEVDLRPVDRWILSRLHRMIGEVAHYMEEFQFNHALNGIRTFFWQEFCDMYIEEVKHRLYEEKSDADAAKLTLHHVLWHVTRLLAPFTPHLCEELYHTYFSSIYRYDSIHQADWPIADEDLIDEDSEEIGRLLNSVVSSIRRFKSGEDMPLNEELSRMEIYASDGETLEKIEAVATDIEGAARVEEFGVEIGEPEVDERVRSIEPRMTELGPRLKGNAKLVGEALKDEDPQKIINQLEEGEATIWVEGEEFTVMRDDVRVSKKYTKSGREVETMDLPEFDLTILITV